MSENWLEKWYKESYARASAEKPRAGIWSRIEAGMRAFGVKWQDADVVSIPERPKASVWEALSAFVDNEILLQRQAKIRRIRTALSSVLLIFSPFILADFSDATFRNAPDKYAVDEHIASFNSVMMASNESEMAAVSNGPNRTPEQSNKSSTGFMTFEANGLKVQNSELTLLNKTSEDLKGFEVEPDAELVQKIPVSTIELLPINGIAYNVANSKNERPSALLESAVQPSGLWFLGASCNYQLTNLYNPTTGLGLDSKSHVTNLHEANFSFDLSVFRTINTRSAIRLGLRLNDRKAQSYQDFKGTEYLEKNLALNYQTIAFSYHRSIAPKLLPQRIGIEFSSGLFASYLTSISERVNQQDEKLLSDGFRKYDFGINVGLHGVYKLSGPVHISIGVFYSNGLINVFRGVEKIPARFYQTYTSSYGASLGIRYLLNH